MKRTRRNQWNPLILKIMVQTIYDIVKAHGGELKAYNIETGGTEFIISLP